MISNTAVFLVVLPILIVVFTLMDPLGALKADRTQEPKALPELPVAQVLPTPVLLPRPAVEPSLAPTVKASAPEVAVAQRSSHEDDERRRAEQAFLDEVDSDEPPLVEPPEGWEQMAEYQGRTPMFDYSESDRYSISDNAEKSGNRMISDEYIDEARGFYQAPIYETEPEEM